MSLRHPTPRPWLRLALPVWLLGLAFAGSAALAQTPPRVVDLPTRPGVTQRFLYLSPASPASPKASVILFAGGHGGLQLSAAGEAQWGKGNFLVRTRQHYADAGFAVAVIDAPSDRQAPPFLSGVRQTPDHRADVLAVIAWLRQQAAVPVWVAGTSRGTQSAGYVATEASPAQGGPDGLVLTATILTDNQGRAVPAMPLERLAIPVLVVHHTQDGCRLCAFSDMPRLMDKLARTPRAELISVSGGINTGDPCEARAYHGFNGLDAEVSARITGWMLAAKP